MITRRLFLIAILLFAPLLTSVGCRAENEPVGPLLPWVYLTFESEDTATAITVNYHTTNNVRESYVYWDVTSKKGVISEYANRAAGKFTQIPGVYRTIHSVELNGLTPDTTYYFVFGDAVSGFSQEYKFRTLPNDNTPIEFVQGGDMDIDPIFIEVSKSAITSQTRALLIGGDIAYEDGNVNNFGRWDEWLKNMMKTMITPDGHLIPLILAIGNHETNASSGGPLERAPFYFNYFPQNGSTSYFTRRLGAHTVLHALDTDHITPHGGVQANWLKSETAKYSNVKNKMAMYHVPLYPSVRSYDGGQSKDGRTNWVPIFDSYKLTVAFENHDHALKRSKPLKNNKESKDGGTIYLGDGCWGKGVRTATSRWYLDVSKSERHVWQVQASESGLNFKAIGIKGVVFDQYQINH